MNPSREVHVQSILGTLLGSCLLVGAAHAFVPPESHDGDVDLLAKATLALDPDRSTALQAALQRSPAWREWTQRHPGWRVEWNLRTGTPHRLYGPGLQVSGPLTSASVESACRQLVAEHAALLGASPEALRLIRAERRLGRWYVVFEQLAAGFPVRGGRVDVRLTDGGQVVLLGSDWHRDVHVPSAPSLARDAAIATATRGLGSPTTEVDQALVVVPEPSGDGYAYHLAYELEFRTREPLGDWLALVDAQTGTLLRRENRIRYASLIGRITAQIEPATVGDPYSELPLRDTRFNVGPGTVEFGYTDADGRFDVATSAVDSIDVRTRLSGSSARVYNYQLGMVTPAIGARMLPGSGRDFLWDDSNSRASERDAYFNTLLAHQTIKGLDPAFTGLDYTMPITVDIYDQDCNAYWDGFGINFFGESGRCANTARIADVVLHEYAHGITDRLYQPLAPSAAMHEAFSDYYAATITDQPLIGRGFRFPGDWLRSVDNTNHYPEDWTGEPHRDGLILAGALWDLRAALGRARVDTLYHFARYGLAETYDDYLLDILVTDDDNGDIYDGTPHFDAIVAAFMAHGIGDYSVQIVHAPEPDTEDLGKPLRLTAGILSIFALDPASLQVHFAAGGGAWTSLGLLPAGGGSRDFAATLPAQASGTTVRYYITAADTMGHVGVLPPAGDAAPFEFRVGVDTTPPVIVHAPLPDQPLDAPGWPLRATVSDNLDRRVASVRADWSRNSPALDHALPLGLAGLSLWRANLPVDGASLGDSVFYRLAATDSAQSPNAAQAPAAGHYAFRLVQGFARDLEANDAGLAASGDWAWGTPAAGPVAYSGTSVWGTGIGGFYNNDRVSLLETGDIDLGGWNRAALVFEHFVSTESYYDGGQVQISTDQGANWTTLVPSGGYPFPRVDALAEPGWSGDSDGWERAEFELSRYLGRTVRVRWRFVSDVLVVDRGWFLDDIEVVERQVLSVPLDLQAGSGRDSQVPLVWHPPAGIDPAQPGTPLQGYHVYRATEPDLSNAVRLTTAPVTTSAFVDLTAVNTTTYFYFVTAVYAAGESQPSSPASGQAYVSGYACDATSLYLWVPAGGPADTTLTFTNTGAGFLNLNVWLGDAADTSLDQVRIAYDVQGSKPGRVPAGAESHRRPAGVPAKPAPGVRASELRRFAPPAAAPPSASWQLVHTDPAEGPTPDLENLYVAESGDALLFKLTGHQAWGSPLADFNLVLGIDTDADRSTGDAGGEDLYVVIGPFALEQVGVPAILTNPDHDLLGIPPYQHIPTGADSLEVGVPMELLGGAGQRIHLSVAALQFDLQTPIDVMPDRRDTAGWLQPEVLHVSVPAGQPTPLALLFPGTATPGHHVGKLFLETNAPATPVAVIPVTYDYATTAVEIRDLAAVEEEGDVLVRWRTGRETDVAAFRVFRSRDDGALERLAPDLPPAASHLYAYRDRAPEPGRYLYRVGEVGPDGSVTLHGGVQATVVRHAPAVAFLDPAAPNPFNPSTTLRYGVAARGPVEITLYDAHGRVVRTLQRVRQAEPGYYRVDWDGRDDRGARVASGVYHVRLVADGQVRTRRLTLVK